MLYHIAFHIFLEYVFVSLLSIFSWGLFSVQFSCSVVSPWTVAHQASLSITNSWSLFKLMCIELVMPSSHLILCQPLLLLPPIPPSIRVLLSSASLSAIRVVSSAYLRLLIFLPAILIPDCASSSPAFHIIYSAYKLNKQGDNIQPWLTPFPIYF